MIAPQRNSSVKLFIIILCLLVLTLETFSQDPAVIKGMVTGDAGEPLAFANVYLGGTFDGGMTAADGSFSFATRETNDVSLIVSMVGYKQFTMTVTPHAGDTISLSVQLRIEPVQTQTVVVRASSYGTEEGKGIVVSPMEILMTPGAAADIFQTLKTLPGLTQVSESAALYVRGGDPTETITLLDGASLYHPYTYESAYGGLFSNMNTNIIREMYFSSGGFSVKYGNALSGVLDMQTRNEPEFAAYNIGINLAGGSLSARIPIAGSRFGVGIEGRQSLTEPIMWLNGTLDDFTLTPRSRDVGIHVSGRYSDTGRIKTFLHAAQDKQGVHVRRPEYNGEFNGRSDNYLVNVHHTDALSPYLIIHNSISVNRYEGTWKLGALDLARKSDVYKVRADIDFFPTSKFKMIFGSEIEERVFSYRGRVPDEEFNIRPDAPSSVIDIRHGGRRFGGYSEVELAGFLGSKDLSVLAGARVDYIDEIDLLWVDPRLSLGYTIGTSSALRASVGIFQQIPDPRLYDPHQGNPALKPMRAVHYIAAYDYSPASTTNFRVEFYHKEYDRLPREHPHLRYDNSGHGFARGIDMVAKGRLSPRLEGWVSYGLVDSKRNWLDYEEYSPSSYDVTHNVTVVAMYRLSDSWRGGINCKYATGRPYSPVIASEYRFEQDVYEPVYGARNSVRFDDFRRLDARLMHFRQVFGRYFTVYYLEVINVLNNTNLFGYSYSDDYSERHAIRSYFGRRTIVFGMALNL
jgi:vitamin B12 transporter